MYIPIYLYLIFHHHSSKVVLVFDTPFYKNGRNRGDLVVELFVETPTDLTARQRELLEELALSFGEGQNPRNSSFAGKAKRFWADILGNQDADGSKENAV